MIDLCRVVKCSVFKWWTETRLKKPVYSPKCLVFQWSAMSCHLTIWIQSFIQVSGIQMFTVGRYSDPHSTWVFPVAWFLLQMVERVRIFWPPKATKEASISKHCQGLTIFGATSHFLVVYLTVSLLHFALVRFKVSFITRLDSSVAHSSTIISFLSSLSCSNLHYDLISKLL